MFKLLKIESLYFSNSKVEWRYLSLFSVISVLGTFLMLKSDFPLSLLLVVGSLGLIGVLLCAKFIDLGFYLIITLGFFVAALNRMFMDSIPLTSALLALPCFLICLILFKGKNESRGFGFKMHPVYCLYLISLAYLVVEIFNPEMDSLLGWLSSFWQSLSYLALLFISSYIFNDIKKIRIFFKYLAGIIFLTALYACIQQWFGFSSFDQRWLYAHPRTLSLYSTVTGNVTRKFSFLTDPSNFGTLMGAGALIPLILAIMGPYRKKEKIMLGIFTAIILLGMSYSGTRTANIMVIAGLIVYILMTLYHKKTQILAIIAGFLFLFILYVPIYSNVTLNRFRSAFGPPSQEASYKIRLVHRQMMQSYMTHHPFGGGVNTAGLPGLKYNPHHFLAGFPPDGAYFSVALNVGLVGLAIECIFYFLTLFYCIHYFYKCKNNEIRLYYAIIAAFLFALMLGSYTQFTISPVPQSLIFVPLLSIIVRLHTFDKVKNI